MVRIPPIPRLVVRAHDPARAWRRRATGAIAVALVVVAAWFGGAWLAAPLLTHTKTQYTGLREEFVRQSEVLEEVRAGLAAAERNAQVAQAANQALQETLREREQEIAALRADLGFYERLVGGSQRRALGVHGIALRALDDPRAFAFELTLTQNLKKSALTEGTVEIAIEGVRDGQVVTVPWRELSSRGDAAPLDFAFKYFQRLQGTLALPAGLTPNRILVSAASKGGERAQHGFAWAEALAPKENDDAGFDNKKGGSRPSLAVDTLIGAKVTLRGELVFAGGLHIDGTVIGSVTAEPGADALLVVSEHGRVDGEIRAPHVVINGTIKGDIHASAKVELAANARIEGDIHYRLLEMAAGAEVNGRIVHGNAEPPPPAAEAGDA